jgi:hypothetical protein
VTIAALHPETSQIHLIRVGQQTFLTGGAVSGVSTMGLPVRFALFAQTAEHRGHHFDDRTFAVATGG